MRHKLLLASVVLNFIIIEVNTLEDMFTTPSSTNEYDGNEDYRVQSHTSSQKYPGFERNQENFDHSNQYYQSNANFQDYQENIDYQIQNYLEDNTGFQSYQENLEYPVQSYLEGYTGFPSYPNYASYKSYPRHADDQKGYAGLQDHQENLNNVEQNYLAGNTEFQGYSSYSGQIYSREYQQDGASSSNRIQDNQILENMVSSNKSSIYTNRSGGSNYSEANNLKDKNSAGKKPVVQHNEESLHQLYFDGLNEEQYARRSERQEVGITNKDTIANVELTKGRKYELLGKELSSMYNNAKFTSIPIVITWDGLVTKYFVGELLGIDKSLQAYIQSMIIKRTTESVLIDVRQQGMVEVDDLLEGLDVERDERKADNAIPNQEPGGHCLYRIEGLAVQTRRPCNMCKTKNIRKCVNTRCDKCNCFICAECHAKKLGQAIVLKLEKKFDTDQICNFCNEIIGMDDENLLYHCLFCKKMERHRKHIYGCFRCGKNIPHRGNCLQHIKTHIGEVPHKCNLCKFQAKSKRLLNKHIQEDH